MIDAINIDDMHRLIAEGFELTEEQKATAKEFEAKAKLNQATGK